MPFAYILKCRDGSLYVGSTRDLARSFDAHQAGLGAIHTARRLPVELAHAEEFDRIEDAYRRERQLHGWSRAKKLALVSAQQDQLPSLARKNF